MFYFLLIILWIIYFVTNRRKPLLNVLFCAFSIVLIGFSFIRYGFGTDYFSYEYMYKNFNPRNFSLGDKTEFGFNLLMAIFKLFSSPFWFFSGCVGAIIILLSFKWIHDMSNDIILSLIIYFSLFSIVWIFSSYRQGIVLAVGLNVYFNDTYNLSNKSKFMITLALSLIHISAVFYFIVLFLDTLKWKKVYNLYLLMFAFVLSFIPYDKILNVFRFIPSIEVLLNNYVEPNFRIIDFPSIVRLTFFGIHYLFYDKVANTEEQRRIFNYIQIGISIYILFKFSEILASRFTIFTLVLIVLSLVDIFHYMKDKYFHRFVIVPYIFLVFISFTFLNKELKAFVVQSNLIDSYSINKPLTIFNKEFMAFDSRNAFRVNNDYYCSIDRTEFIENYDKIPNAKFDENLTYVFVKDHHTNKYGVLNSQGEWLVEPKYDKPGEIYEDILIFYIDGPIFSEIEYVDLSNKNRSMEKLREDLNLARVKALDRTNITQEYTDIKFEDLPTEIQEIVPFKHRVSKPEIMKINSEHFTYYLLKFYYYGDSYYIYISEDMKPMTRYMHKYANRIDTDGIIKSNTDCGRVYINNGGEIIWYE